MTIIPFPTQHARIVQIQSKREYYPTYELFFVKGKDPCSISSTNRDQIHRQMLSLAERRISATVYEDGFPAGYVGPGPKSRNGGFYEAVLFESRLPAQPLN